MDVLMPQLGETVTSGTIIVWRKQPGDAVGAEDILFEVETDKVSMEIPAQASGVLAEILVEEGMTVDVGTRVAVIHAENAAPRDTVEQAPAAAAPGARLSPVVRRLLAENHLNAADIQGTGAGQRIMRGDVLSFLKRRQAPPEDQSVPFNTLRKRTAEHMVRSKSTSPHVLQAVEVDFHAIERLRRKHGEPWKSREGFSLTYLPFVARATCLALKDFPQLNASVREDQLLVHRRVHLAIAVDLSFRGLLAPVIKGSDTLTVKDLARAIHAVSAKARNNQLTPDELTGGTYTLSNSGSFGTFITAPIINQPQVAILSTDGVRKKPVVVEVDGQDSIAIRPIGVLAQSFDHRAVDGAYSAAFLRRMREIIEQGDFEAELLPLVH